MNPRPQGWGDRALQSQWFDEPVSACVRDRLNLLNGYVKALAAGLKPGALKHATRSCAAPAALAASVVASVLLAAFASDGSPGAWEAAPVAAVTGLSVLVWQTLDLNTTRLILRRFAAGLVVAWIGLYPLHILVATDILVGLAAGSALVGLWVINPAVIHCFIRATASKFPSALKRSLFTALWFGLATSFIRSTSAQLGTPWSQSIESAQTDKSFWVLLLIQIAVFGVVLGMATVLGLQQVAKVALRYVTRETRSLSLYAVGLISVLFTVPPVIELTARDTDKPALIRALGEWMPSLGIVAAQIVNAPVFQQIKQLMPWLGVALGMVVFGLALFIATLWIGYLVGLVLSIKSQVFIDATRVYATAIVEVVFFVLVAQLLVGFVVAVLYGVAWRLFPGSFIASPDVAVLLERSPLFLFWQYALLNVFGTGPLDVKPVWGGTGGLFVSVLTFMHGLLKAATPIFIGWGVKMITDAKQPVEVAAIPNPVAIARTHRRVEQYFALRRRLGRQNAEPQSGLLEARAARKQQRTTD